MIDEEVDLPVSSGPAGLVVAPKPLAVQTLTSQVSGHDVTLQWVAPADPNRWGYRIEVGFTPGAVDLYFDVPPSASSYWAAAAPAGTYYVQIRSLNAVTSSAATTPIRVDVH